MDPTYATAPLIMELTGYCYFTNASAATSPVVTNTPVKNALLTAANGAVLGQQATLGPNGRVPVVIFPTTAYAAQVAAGAGNASVVMLDCRQFQADIIYATAAYAPALSATAGALPNAANIGNFNLLAIDNTNKFIYFWCCTAAGAPLTPTVGASMQFDVAFKDTTAI